MAQGSRHRGSDGLADASGDRGGEEVVTRHGAPWSRPVCGGTLGGPARSVPLDLLPVNTHRVGRYFERVAAEMLAADGWSIEGRNVRFGRREIDLVVRRGHLVAFVEVKARRGPDCGDPLEAITAHKRREIEAVARWWIQRFGRPDDVYRFDAVAVRPIGSRWAVEHVEDAWWTGGEGGGSR